MLSCPDVMRISRESCVAREAAPRARPSSKLLIFFVCEAHVCAETRVVPTYCLVKGARMRIMQCQDVFARQDPQEGP